MADIRKRAGNSNKQDMNVITGPHRYAVKLMDKGFHYKELEGGLKVFMPEREGSEFINFAQHARIEYAPENAKYKVGDYIFIHHDVYSQTVVIGDTEYLEVRENELVQWGHSSQILAQTDDSGNVIDSEGIIAKPYVERSVLNSDLIDLDLGKIGADWIAHSDFKSKVTFSKYPEIPVGSIVAYSEASDYEIWYNEQEINWINPNDILFYQEEEGGRQYLIPGRCKIADLKPTPKDDIKHWSAFNKMFESGSYGLGLVKESMIDGIEPGDVVVHQKMESMFLENHFWHPKQFIHGIWHGKVPGLDHKRRMYYKKRFGSKK